MTEVVTVTITDFLLARIAEDLAGYPGVVQTQRNINEAEAKRRIVRLHADDGDGFCVRCRFDVEELKLMGETYTYPCATLCAIAAVYDRHPEYQPEWRV